MNRILSSVGRQRAALSPLPLFLSILLLSSTILSGCIGEYRDLASTETGPEETGLGFASEELLNETILVDGSSTQLAVEAPSGLDQLSIETRPAMSTDTLAGAANDLQIELIAPNGTVVFERSTSLSASAGGGQLPEWSGLADAAPGEWEVSIEGETVPPQEWTIEAQGIALPDTFDPPLAALEDDRIVVAVVDTGVDPYHDAFRSPNASGVPAGLEALEPVELPVQTGATEQAAWQADRHLWYRLGAFDAYAIPETRLTVASAERFVPPDVSGHGTAVASIVANQAPQAHILSVRISEEQAQIADVIRWIAEIEGVDIINLSWADPATPFIHEEEGTTQQIEEATRAAVEEDKLVVVAAGNAPRPVATQVYAGPPWVLAVGLADQAKASDYPHDRVPPDVVTNASIRHAIAGSGDGYERGSATSWAAPNVAGILADAAQLYLEETGQEPTAAQLRSALNATARYPTTTAYQVNRSGPMIPVAPNPAVQYGWGSLGTDEDARAIAACMLTDCPNEKRADIQATMATAQELRRVAWMDVDP